MGYQKNWIPPTKYLFPKQLLLTTENKKKYLYIIIIIIIVIIVIIIAYLLRWKLRILLCLCDFTPNLIYFNDDLYFSFILIWRIVWGDLCVFNGTIWELLNWFTWKFFSYYFKFKQNHLMNLKFVIILTPVNDSHEKYFIFFFW